VTRKILVVDDEPGMRKSLAIILRREDYRVTESASVAEAIGHLKGEDYDLVIADLKMEPLDGLDLLALIQRYRARCPVVIMTAFGTPEVRSEATALGAADFLEKPLEVPHLLGRVRALVALES
jgi:DNA-binding NtrC family response regulator